MKSEKEIKDWIDSKKVLTKVELTGFLYGEDKKRTYTNTTVTIRYWGYVLRTKNMKKLREYRDERIKEGNHRKDCNFLRDIIKKDERFRCGSRKAVKLMKDVYGIKIRRSVVTNYLREYV